MSARYPILLDLADARVLVVGGGPVAQRRVEALVASGGRPVIVAPEVTSALREAIEGAGLVWRARAYESGEAAGYQLVLAATDRSVVNAEIARDARRGGGWVNVADDPAASSFELPAVLRQGEVGIAVSTGGAAPLLSRRLRERLETVVTPGLGRAAERLRDVREQVQARWPDDESRRRSFWFELVTQDFLECAIDGRDGEVESRIEACLSQS